MLETKVSGKTNGKARFLQKQTVTGLLDAEKCLETTRTNMKSANKTLLVSRGPTGIKPPKQTNQTALTEFVDPPTDHQPEPQSMTVAIGERLDIKEMPKILAYDLNRSSKVKEQNGAETVR
jgi:hypothetical protein